MSKIDSNHLPIIISVIAFFLWSFLLRYIYISDDYSGSDAAGNGMAKGYSMLFLFAVFTVSTIIFAGINIYLFNKMNSPMWLKILGLLPIAIWIFVFSAEILEVNKRPSSNKSNKKYLLEYEVKTSRLLVNGRSQYRTSNSGSSGVLPTPEKVEDGYIYSFRTGIKWGSFKMNIYDDYMETTYYSLEREHFDLLPMTEWIPLQFEKNNPPETEVYLRYSIVKYPHRR